MSEEQTPFIAQPRDPPALEDPGDTPIVTLSRHRYNVLLQCERTIRKLGIQDDPDAKAIEVADRVSTAMDILSLLIGDDTVEPKGIISRIERHLVRAFGMIDELTAGQDANTAGLKDVNDRLSALGKDQREIADHDAQIGAARHERLEKLLAFAEVDAPSLAGRLEKIDKAIRDAHDDMAVRLNQQINSFVERFVRLERLMDAFAHVEQRLSNIERAIVAMIARS